MRQKPLHPPATQVRCPVCAMPVAGSERRCERCDTPHHPDCWNYLGLHDQLKLFKHGYSKVTDHASREIRHGRLTRQQALAWVRRCEQAPPAHLDLFCQWLGMDASGLRFMMDRWRHPNWWHAQGSGTWSFKGWSSDEAASEAAATAPLRPAVFQARDQLACDGPERYVVLGKGLN